MRISPDLHTHSTASDGTLTPTQLVRRAADAGVTVLALTDHDTLAGIDEARRAAAECALHLVAGVEISVTWHSQTVHILGLDVATEDPTLNAGLNNLRDFRRWRAEEIGRRLDKVGYAGAFEGAKALSNGRLIGRMHFARFLTARGAAENVRGVFKRFLVKGKPGHVSGQWAELADAVSWIGAAGGQAVIAHPARYGLTRSKMLRLIGEFKEAGGTGIEVVSGSHSRDEYFVFARHAREQNLLASAGSDFHDPAYPWIELGRLPALPEGCTPIWHDWACVPHTEDPQNRAAA
ncbi:MULTISPECIES: PHP domain-containing protein [Thiorhodovibrio]|uniref:PHP domain-containing protein n=1 Tax=Thiorhodovibrio TaxID=61593 RepID=UPI0019144B67|nr:MULTISPECIES: PHP domain-containing protein [Thiorhodovibrio]MBK5967754.1 phosphatase [Thiorhodovibrio winogradskyi]WPL14441.1 Error-prone DNA polymerase [Thiorhodovibrio litoralis]